MPSASTRTAAPAMLVVDQPRVTRDLEPLLRGRLLLLAGLAVITPAFFSIFRAQSPAQWDYFMATAPGRALLLYEGLVCAAALVIAILLKRSLSWSLPGLRAVEYILFGLFGLYIAWTQVFAWASDRFLLNGATTIDPYVVRQAVDAMAGRWLAVIVGFAVLVPETWRRSAAVTIAFAATAMVLTISMALRDPVYRPHAGQMVALMAFWMIVAMTIAIFGAYKLAELRQQVQQAEQLGQYKLVKRIGAGGMGEVFLAEHVMLKQPCAVKLIRPERAGDPAALQRFEREVRATARLEHWNTVQIFDYGYTGDGTFYYAMEYLSGWTLDEMVARTGPLTAGRAIHLLRQVCAALSEAHTAGLLHRDIKPANIIACDRGGVADVVKLVDFGLVRPLGKSHGDPALTAEGTLLGTPAYMSPEQGLGRDDLDGRSDIYSVGAVAYQLVTGRPPFVGDTAMRILMAHVQEPPTPPGQVQAGVAEDLSAVILQCLEKDPARRFATARALDAALAGCADADAWDPQAAADWWRLNPPSLHRPDRASAGKP